MGRVNIMGKWVYILRGVNKYESRSIILPKGKITFFDLGKYNNKGQNVAVEYVLTFFVIVAVVSSMTIYVRRVLQGRMLDSQKYMARIVNLAVTNTVRYETYQYEPYYADADVYREFESTETERNYPGAPNTPGIVQIDYEQRTLSTSVTKQVSPRNAD